MGKRTLLITAILCLFILSSTLVTANIFSDVWNWMTGQATKDGPPTGEGDGSFSGGDIEEEPDGHSECRDEQCIIVAGEGIDECATSLDCPVTHTECNDQEQCIRVEGEGADQCDSHSACEKPSHMECENFSCVEVEGQGIDECAIDFDCRVLHTECNENQQCVKVEGPGTRQCNFNVDCEPDLKCEDFDVTDEFPDGKNPFLRSDTSDGKFTTEDWCSKVPEILIEYYCEDGILRETSTDCESLGDFECLNGQCVKRPTPFERFIKRIFDL